MRRRRARAQLDDGSLERPNDWPAFLVQRAGEPRQVLHLARGRRGAGRRDLGTDPLWWRRVQTSLAEALTERQRWNFTSKDPAGEWGSFEQLLWHLTLAPEGARTQRALFAALPVVVL